ncbi:MAG: hypothetical protein AW07_00831 [Candidatus Accumulibacter sp. SK-11]|nr:MAG: hypothetical protein AW07_00831 [Candidatus Accumulibacter sp. SK-11]
MEEVQCVRLQDLAGVHQPAHLLGSRRQMIGTHHLVERLGCRQVMRHRADAAQALHHHRHFPIRPALNELLEAPELHDVQPRLLHLVVIVEQQRHLAVPFDARQRVEGNAPQLASIARRAFQCKTRACHDCPCLPPTQASCIR